MTAVPLSDHQRALVERPVDSKVFLEGPAGAGKTTAGVARLLRLLDAGVWARSILVMVPLIVPLGEAFGIDPIHLGIIFLANLELGYLTPPVGLNLFLAAYRFEVPLVKIYKDVLPFFLVLLVAVLLITYLPWISTGFLSLLGL